MKIGLLMVADENDILEDTLAENAERVDCFYVLDGSANYEQSVSICYETGKCADYTHDIELDGRPVDGARQMLYEQAVAEHGYDNWFLLLHGDELWNFDPDEVIERQPDADGFEFRLPFSFPRYWDPAKSAFEQLSEFMLPGFPEFRMFRGSPDIYYLPEAHHQTCPFGIQAAYRFDGKQILHYLYRSPAQQYARAARNKEWSHENWDDLERLGPFWDDQRIAAFCERSEHYTHSAVFAY